MSSRVKWAIAILLFALAVALPQLISSAYIVRLMILTLMNAMMAMAFVMGLRAGLLNISLAGFWGIGAYTTGMIATKTDLPVWSALPISVVVAVAVSIIVGLILLRGSALSFIIGSLVVAFIVPLVFGTFDFFEGYVGIIGISPPEAIPLGSGAAIRFASEPSFFYLLLALSVAVMLVFLALYRSWAGRAWLALGLSPDLAQTVAINPYRYRLAVFAVSSGAVAVLGFFFAVYSSVLQPSVFDAFKSIYIQMYAVLGGIAFPFAGPLLGAAVLTILPEALRLVGDFEPIVTGALIIVIVVLMPQGILGLLSGRRAKDMTEFMVALGRKPGAPARGDETAAEVDGEAEAQDETTR